VKQPIIMPNLGAASDEATLVSWLVHAGDRVRVGQPLYDVETDKSTVTVEATEPGLVAEILVQEGATVAIGTPIATLEIEGEGNGDVMASPAAEPPASIPAEAIAHESRERGVHRLSPRARTLAERLGVDPSDLTGSGPDGRVVEADIQAAFDARQSESAQGAQPAGLAHEDQLAGLTGYRAVVARAMSASSHDTAAVTLTVETRASGLLAAIEKLRGTYPQVSAAITVDLVIAAVVGRALRRHPHLNASLGRDGITVHAAANVGIAIDSERGLIVPVLNRADTRSIEELASDWGALRGRALAGGATPNDLTGGTFTVTNLGPMGIDAFTPIINRAECGILGIGRIAQRAVVVDGLVSVEPTVVLSLTFDHRIVDGAPAARFLGEVAAILGKSEAILEQIS
jgi:pyruvate dehydrogenase E2 component (dihydrolipoamide acetyltransferase)